MQTIKQFGSSEIVYAGDRLSTQSLEIDSEMIDIDYKNIIDTQFTGGNVSGKFNDLKRELGLGMYSTAPCGGFINFFNIVGSKGNDYIIYSGVNEISNSQYIVTIHKILK